MSLDTGPDIGQESGHKYKEAEMVKKEFTAEQIVRKLREAGVLRSKKAKVEQVVQ